MTIDWKKVSKSDGYRRFKAGLCVELQRRHANKKECYALFHRIIGYAQRQLHHYGAPIELVLYELEIERENYSWSYFYGRDRFNPVPKKYVLKQRTVRWALKLTRDKTSRLRSIMFWQKENSIRKKNGNKPRWEKWRRRHHSKKRSL